MEQRLQKRVAKNLLARIKLPTHEFFGYVLDIAKTGIGLACNRETAIGAELTAYINAPGRKTMEVAGKVLWQRKLPALSKNKFQYGIKLEKMPPEWEEYVEEEIRRQYERRKHKRFQAALEVGSEDVLDLLDAAVEDVSAKGLYIRSSRPLVQGAQYDIVINSPELYEPIKCVGETVAVFQCEPDEQFDHPYGAGIKIISFVGDDGERFSTFIKQLEKLYKFHWPDEDDKNVDLI